MNKIKDPDNVPSVPTKHAGGRPSKYDPKFCQEIIKFFDIPRTKQEIEREVTHPDGRIEKFYKQVPNDLPLFTSFAHSLGVTRDCLNDWVNKYHEFAVAHKRAQDLQESILIDNTMRSRYAQPFAIFTAKNLLKWTDRHEIIEMKFIFDFVGKLSEVFNRNVPDQCPHCKKDLALREKTISELESACKAFDTTRKGKTVTA